MSLKKITNVLFLVGLMLVFSGAVPVAAEGEGKPESQNTSTKPCKDYDRPNSGDEEKTSGNDCPGTTPTPEPISIILFSAGLAGVGFAARRKLRRTE